MIEMICTCNHKQSSHSHNKLTMQDDEPVIGVCLARLGDKDRRYGDCPCWEFKADNLRYLEELAHGAYNPT